MGTSDGGDEVVILIVDSDTGEVLGQCSGAAGLGECPRAVADETVPCAGRRLVPQRGTGAEGWTVAVSACQAGECPLAWLPVRTATGGSPH